MKRNDHPDRNRLNRAKLDYEKTSKDKEPKRASNPEEGTLNDWYRRINAQKKAHSGNGKPSPGQEEKGPEKFDLRGRVTDLNTPLLRFNLGGGYSQDPRNYWTLRDAVRGVQIFGGIGSGKSPGSGRMLALTYLKSGFGGIVLTGKIDEVNEWKRYAEITGRTDDLIIFEKGKPLYFNPLQYEASRDGSGKGETYNLVNLIMSIYEMGRSFEAGGGGSNNERFWDNALMRCISRIVDLLKMSGEEVSVFNMRKVLISMMTKEEALEYNKLKKSLGVKNASKEEKQRAEEHLTNKIESNYCLKCLASAYRKADKTAEEAELYQFVQDYFFRTIPKMPEKTRAIIEESYLGLIEAFMSGILKEHFTQGLSPELSPEETYLKGKIVVINFPVKEYLKAGVYAQAIYKKLWQEAIERRDAKKDPLPIFMWVDEAQYFLNEQDARFQTTARSSRACTVLISQNISNYYAAIGGKNPRDDVNSLLGNLATKIFHANNDSVTNNWAAETIGKTFRTQQSTSSNFEHMSGSTSMSQALHYQVEPQHFTVLKSGGEENHGKVEGIITVAGKEFSNNRNFTKVIFDQNFLP